MPDSTPVGTRQESEIDEIRRVAGHHYLHPHTTSGSMALISRDVVYQSAAEGPKSYEAWETNHERLVGAFRITLAEIRHQATDGDLVITHWRGQGEHIGAFMGIEPTGRLCDMRGFGIDRVRDGLVVEHWGLQDALGLLKQLGGMVSVPNPPSKAG